MKLWFSGPSFFGIRPGVSFDAGQSTQRQTAPRVDGSFVYVVRGDHNMIKIGVTTNPAARLAQLRTGSPFPIEYAFIGATPGNGYDIEQAAHAMLAPHRVNGEWFDVSPELAISAVMGAAGKLGRAMAPASLEIGSAPAQPVTLPPAPPLGIAGALMVAFRTAVYSVMTFVMLAVIAVMSGSVPDWLGTAGAVLPFLMLWPAYSDTKRRRAAGRY